MTSILADDPNLAIEWDSVSIVYYRSISTPKKLQVKANINRTKQITIEITELD